MAIQQAATIQIKKQNAQNIKFEDYKLSSEATQLENEIKRPEKI